ncbi:MAG: sugar phosphate nucleotidyltransferase [bacterium]|nr:sugar phosphate nucleotidyltransferase [bacterium]
MIDTCTLLLAGGRGERLFPLTRNRAKPSVPFGGIYSIIDFTISNCLHSGLQNVHVLTQYASLPLERHIRKIWPTTLMNSGLFVELVPPQGLLDDHWYVGTADAIYQNLFLIEQENPERVLILSGDHIYKMDYRKLIDYHEQNGADLTVTVIPLPFSVEGEYHYLTVDHNLRVVGVCDKTSYDLFPIDYSKQTMISTEIYCFRTNELINLVNEDHQDSSSTHDFCRDIIPQMLSKGLRVFAYPFQDENKKEILYWRDISSIDQYFSANMDLVDVDPLFNLYDTSWPIYTEPISSLPPAKTVFDDDDRRGSAVDSLISPGCIISGGSVKKSILSPNCFIHSWSEVTNSILLKGVDVGRYSRIRRTIIEEGVEIPPNTEIGYNEEEDRKKYFVSHNGIVVVTNNHTYPL